MGINEYIKIGEKIKKARIAAGLTQKDMAQKLDLSVSTYSNYENEHREPPLNIIKSICNILGTDVSALISDVGIKSKSESPDDTLEVTVETIREKPELFDNIIKEIINRSFFFFFDEKTAKLFERDKMTKIMLSSPDEEKAEFINKLVKRISYTKTGNTLSVHIEYKENSK